MKFTIGKRIAVGYLFAAVALIVLGLVSHSSTTRFMAANENALHTYKVLLELDDVLADIKDAEMSIYGYVIAGDTRFLELYRKATNSHKTQIDDVRMLMVGLGPQEARLNELEALVKTKFEALEQIRLSHSPANADQTAISASIFKSKVELDLIRSKVSELIQAEEISLKDRSEKASSLAGTAELTIVVGTIVTCLLLIFIGLGIARSIALPLARVTAVADNIAGGELSAAQQTAESLRQSTSAIDQLNDAASGLRTSVTRFKVQS